jgi:hypothetical protein
MRQFYNLIHKCDAGFFAKNCQTRSIYNFIKTRDEVAIGNNSLLFFIHGAIIMHGPKAHPSLRIIIPEFWLDKAHSDYDNLPWGQTPRALPWYTRREFAKLFPKHPYEKLISWQQFKTLRSHTIKELQNYSTIYHGTPEIIKNSDNYQIILPHDTFHVPQSSFFYNSWRVHRKNHGLVNLPLNILSHTELYKHAKNDIPEQIGIIGAGRSVVWLAQHFPNTMLHCIVNKEHALARLQNESEQDSTNYYSLTDFPPHGKKYIIETNNLNHNSRIIEVATGTCLFEGAIFTAIGMQHSTETVMNINHNNVLNYPYNPIYNNWISAEELPLGGMTEATLRWAEATNNLDWSYELYCYHEEPFRNMLTRKLAEEGIIATSLFFDILKKNILKLGDDNLYEIPIHIRSQEVILDVYQQSYAQACNSKNLDPEIKKTFAQILRNDKQKRIQQYNHHPMDIEMTDTKVDTIIPSL